jgi:hypothetical protein
VYFASLMNTKLCRTSDIKIFAGFLLFSVFLLTVWLLGLEYLPGLHGDEAWSGLKAESFAREGIKQLHGMNNYTGILQALIAEATFRGFGISVFNLRVPGVICNAVGLVLICWRLRNSKATVLVFLLIYCQSALFLTSVRIAWEVNTFSLFFFSIVFVSAYTIVIAGTWNKKRWIFLFLLTNIVGSYNHLIFSTLGLSLFVGFILFSVYFDNNQYKKWLVVLFVNLINLGTVFLLMNYAQTKVIEIHGFLPFVVGGLVTLESSLLLRYQRFFNFTLYSPRARIGVVIAILGCFCAFVVFHGRAFFEVLSGWKIMLQTYSLESPYPLQLILSLCAGIVLLYLLHFIWLDLQTTDSSLFAIILITFGGVLCLYTIRTSFRYYLIINILVSLYMAYRASINIRKYFPLLLTFIMSFIFITYLHGLVLSNKQRPLRAVNFTIGNNQPETSAHFLPKEVVIAHLRLNNISEVDYRNEHTYFMTLPIQFYQSVNPWTVNPNKRLVVGYDFKRLGSGYYFVQED